MCFDRKTIFRKFLQFTHLFVITSVTLVYANINESLDQNSIWIQIKTYMNTLTIDGLIGALFVLVMAFISAHFYNHKEHYYARNKKRSYKSITSFKYMYRYIQTTTILASCGSFLINHPILLEIHNNLVLQYVGISISSIGMVLFISSKLTLGEQYSPCFDSFVPKDIINEGIYKYIRHPIYTSNFILLSGMAIATGSGWIIANIIILFFYYIFSAYSEESELKRYFPEYQRYIKQTNMFFPTQKVVRNIVNKISANSYK